LAVKQALSSLRNSAFAACREDACDVRDIIGHAAGYGLDEVLTKNALAEFAAITRERPFLPHSLEQAAQEDAARVTADAIARVCRSVQTEHAERQTAEAKILALLDSPAATHDLAA
jgi:hypothetical protein